MVGLLVVQFAGVWFLLPDCFVEKNTKQWFWWTYPSFVRLLHKWYGQNRSNHRLDLDLRKI
jgi:hypothetical protein